MARIDKAAMPPARSCKPRKLIRGRPQLQAGLIPLIHAKQAYIYFTARVKEISVAREIPRSGSSLGTTIPVG